VTHDPHCPWCIDEGRLTEADRANLYKERLDAERPRLASAEDVMDAAIDRLAGA
jgi:hypothetical protein